MQFETYEFLTTLNIDVDRNSATAKAVVPEKNSVFDHHFPDYPILPGAYQIEIAAQSSGYLCLAHMHWEQLPLLMAVDKARFRQPIVPGTHIHVRTKILHLGSSYGAVTNRLEQEDGTCFANVDIRLRFFDFPSDKVKQHTMKKFLRVVDAGPSRQEVLDSSFMETSEFLSGSERGTL